MADLKLARCECSDCRNRPVEECLELEPGRYLLVAKAHRRTGGVTKIAKGADREQEREATVRDLIATKEAARNRFAKAAAASTALEIADLLIDLGRETLGTAAVGKSRSELCAAGARADGAIAGLYGRLQLEESRASRRR